MKPINLKAKSFRKLVKDSKIKYRGNSNRALIILDHYEKSKIAYKVESSSWERSKSKQSFISLTGGSLYLF